MVITYSIDDLKGLNHGVQTNIRSNTSVVSRAMSLGIASKTKTHRGSKGSLNRIQKIISTDRKSAVSGQPGARLSNLIIPRENEGI